MKICNKCNKAFEVVEGNFYHHSMAKDGYRNTCIECYKKERYEYAHKSFKPKSIKIQHGIIKRKREEMGISAEKASRLLDMNYSTYRRMEDKSIWIKKEVWEKLNKLYGLE